MDKPNNFQYSLQENSIALGLDMDELIPILYIFDEESLSQAENATIFWNNKNYENMQKIIHSIKGAALNLKVEPIGSLATQIDLKLKLNDLEKLQELFDELKRQVALFHIFIQNCQETQTCQKL